MKILVFSDIHGCFSSLEKILSIFNNEHFDKMIIAGDYNNHGPRNGVPQNYDPKKVTEMLNSYADKIICVRGNCDSEVDQMILNFPMLNESAQVFFDTMRIFVHHGHLSQYNQENLTRLIPASTNTCKTLVISGHTHIPVLEENNGITFLNPGSITFPKGGSVASYAQIDTETNKIELKELK